MSQPKSLLFSLLFSSVAFQGGFAQDLSQTIVGCEDVGCPLDNYEPHCTLTNITFENIGLTRIPDVPDSLEDFSIVKGVNISLSESNTFTSKYYLGTPQNVNLTKQVHGCAVIFHDPPQQYFQANGTHTCSEVISQSCIDAIQNRGTTVAKENSDEDEDDLCSALQNDLDKNRISQCENMTGGQKFIGNVTVKALSSLKNIDSASNSTSDCWPILPRSENLAEMFTEVVSLDGVFNGSTAYPELERISPLLTVFVKGSNGSSIVNQTVSRLTCIAMNTTQTIADADGKSAASRSTINVFAALSSAFALFALMM